MTPLSVPSRPRDHGKTTNVSSSIFFPLKLSTFQPHEDGPSYHPVVATISLGSHTIFHYYSYKSDNVLATAGSAGQPSTAGRLVDSTPVLSLLLEPRSVIITTSSLYTSHLHGIQELNEDIIVAAAGEDQMPLVGGLDVPIANWHMLTGEKERSIMQNGGTLRRGTRYSLTCRDVERVASGVAFLKR
jgi:alkylated DNA repair protein alkB family protein 6